LPPAYRQAGTGGYMAGLSDVTFNKIIKRVKEICELPLNAIAVDEKVELSQTSIPK
jgi:hypothetical protein